MSFEPNGVSGRGGDGRDRDSLIGLTDGAGVKACLGSGSGVEIGLEVTMIWSPRPIGMEDRTPSVIGSGFGG